MVGDSCVAWLWVGSFVLFPDSSFVVSKLMFVACVSGSSSGQASIVFAAVFCAVWLGSAVVTVNAQLLGGTISFFQSVCVLGYCVFPMTMAALCVDLLKLIPLGPLTLILDLAVLGVAFLWSTRASSVFIGQYIVASRRVLAVFPVLFFYTFLAWLILLF